MKSLRLRLLVGTLFWIGLSLLVSGIGLGELFAKHTQEQLYSELKLHLDQLTARLDYNDDDKLYLTELPSDPRFSKPLSGLYWQINKIENDQLLDGLRSRSLWDQALKLPVLSQLLARFSLSFAPNQELYVLARKVELDGQNVQLAVAMNKSFIDGSIGQFQHELWLSLLVLGLGLVLAALVQVWMGMAPLNRLRKALAQVRGGSSAALKGNFPQEVMPLVEDFNFVLKQNALMVERAQTQAGNLAHALKTPLTVLANAAYSEPDNTLSALIESQILQAQRQVEYHLKRASALASAKQGYVRTPVEPVVSTLLAVIERLHQREVNFDFKPSSEPVAFKGAKRDLEEMLGNLLDNAGKWANTQVSVTLSTDNQNLVICVDDDGPGLADELKEKVLARGVRADERVQGSGLGLAIVTELASIYHGSLSLHDSPLGGLKAKLCLPRAESEPNKI